MKMISEGKDNESKEISKLVTDMLLTAESSTDVTFPTIEDRVLQTNNTFNHTFLSKIQYIHQISK